MSVGLAFWLASELRELARTSGDASRAKRAKIDGHAVARLATGDESAQPPACRGLRPRPVYLLLALTFGGGGVYVAIGSIAHYFRPQCYVADIAWLLSLALVVAAVAFFYAAVNCALCRRASGGAHLAADAVVVGVEVERVVRRIAVQQHNSRIQSRRSSRAQSPTGCTDVMISSGSKVVPGG